MTICFNFYNTWKNISNFYGDLNVSYEEKQKLVSTTFQNQLFTFQNNQRNQNK